MRILQINAVYSYGSTGRNVQELHEWYLSHGHESFVACAMFYGCKPVNSYTIGNVFDRKVHACLSRVFDEQGLFSNLPTIALLNYIQKIKPDVVHIHNYHSNYVNYRRLLSFLKKRGIPTAVTLHDCFPFTGKCFYFGECQQWKDNACTNCTAIENVIPSLRIRNAAHEAYQIKYRLWKDYPRLAVVGVSKWITQTAEQSMMQKASTFFTIYNWVDRETFYPRTTFNPRLSSISEYRYVLLAAAVSWPASKGLTDLLQIAQTLGNDYLLIIVGRVSEKDKKSLSNVIYWGRTSNVDEMAQLYSFADVFVNPSRLETFGKVTIEAMACGTPAVVYDTTACTELVPEGCGKVVPLLNVGEMENAIRQICQVGKTKYSEACNDWVDRNFTLENCALKHVELFSRLRNIYER